jgi:low temperature requirement protein LtrA
MTRPRPAIPGAAFAMPGFTFGPRPAILGAMKRNLLRDRDASHEERVGFVELFFDLVFVFAVTQVSHTLIVHPDPMGFLQAAMLFVAIWWVWVETAWVTNWLDVSHIEVRLLLFALMGAGLVMSISLPEAFGGRALVFAIAYLAIQLGRHTFMLLALGAAIATNFRNFVRIFIWALVEAPFWIAGAFRSRLARAWPCGASRSPCSISARSSASMSLASGAARSAPGT